MQGAMRYVKLLLLAAGASVAVALASSCEKSSAPMPITTGNTTGGGSSEGGGTNNGGTTISPEQVIGTWSLESKDPKYQVDLLFEKGGKGLEIDVEEGVKSEVRFTWTISGRDVVMKWQDHDGTVTLHFEGDRLTDGKKATFKKKK